MKKIEQIFQISRTNFSLQISTATTRNPRHVGEQHLLMSRRGAALARRGCTVLPQSRRASSSSTEQDEQCVVRATDGADGDGVNGARRHRVRFKETDVMVTHGETLRTALLRTGTVTPHNGRSQLINCRGAWYLWDMCGGNQGRRSAARLEHQGTPSLQLSAALGARQQEAAFGLPGASGRGSWCDKV